MVNFIRFLSSKLFVINLLVAILLFVGIVYIALEYLENYTLHGETISVPDYQGKLWSDTLGQSDPNFELIISDSIYQNGAEKNLILDQNPAPLTTVKQGRKIYLTVSSSRPPTVSMPKLVDLSLRQATSLMEIYGLQIGELTYRPDPCINCILEQKFKDKNVPAGARLRKGTRIDLVVGQGFSKEKVPVPYLIGLPLKSVNYLLKDQSLNLGSISYEGEFATAEDSANAEVVDQFPKYTDEPSIYMGASINITLVPSSNTNSADSTVNSPD
ncbi:MAG: hypothetical protein CMP59_07050 [Flavobacteriales bacterium]|nr:hypothetical protein [Flavobacteriales bacterium]|tara:strand:+ start:1255 stop:2067 length:813 start_codon:yes stop_codon:yes gene_type:complete